MKSIALFTADLRMILLAAIISFTIAANAQNVAVNTTGSSADASAMLDVSSTTKGFLAPRMTTVQRTGIPSPANGLLVFDTDTKTYWYFSTIWKEISNEDGVGNFALPYNGAYADPAKVFSITNTNTTNGASAIHGKIGNGSGMTLSTVTAAVWADNSIGYGVLGTSTSGSGVTGISALSHGVMGTSGNSEFAGVYGINSSPNGIGVLGLSTTTGTTNGAVTAINQSSGIALYAESIYGGTAVYGKTSKQNGPAIYGINNATQGYAIRGAALGSDGVAIYGDAGLSNSNSYAGYFRNWNANNSKNVIQIDNLGTGNFLSLQDGLGDTKTSIAKNGNISTDGSLITQGAISTQGTVTVKGNKGIIRSSTSSQMRYEAIQAVVEALDGSALTLCGNCTMYRTINFPNAFSSAPAVSLGNQISGNGYADLMLIKVMSVTSNSCVLRIENNLGSSISFKGTWNLIAIGPE